MTAVYQSTSAQKAAHWCGSVESMLRQRQEWIDDPAAMAGSPEAMRLMPDFLLSLDYYQQDYAFHHRLATGLISRIDWDRGQDGSARYVVEALASYFQITGSLSLWDEARQQIGPILGETPAGAGSLTAPEIPAESHAGRRPVSVYTFFAEDLGLQAAEPGFTCVRFAPTGFLGTPEETSGSFPLPPGTVSAAYDNQAGRSTYSVSIPTGLHLLPVLPATETDFLLVNGEPVDEDSKIVWTDHSVTLAVLPGSDYVFEVRRETS